MQDFKTKKHLFLNILISFLIFHLGFAQEVQSTKSDEPHGIKIADGLYVLEKSGCNITVSDGTDGILVIDSGYKRQAEQNRARIASISPSPIRYILNTHFHYDHVGGNELFAEKGAIIIAHENTRKRLAVDLPQPFFNRTIRRAPEAALPTLTFQSKLTLHFNGDEIHLQHRPGHSDGDITVFFKNANILLIGDLYFNGIFPNADIYSGGSINLMIEVMNDVIKIIDDETIIIPGHGPPSNKSKLQVCVAMMKDIRNQIQQLMQSGKSLEEIIQAMPTKKYEKEWRYGSFTPQRMIEYYYMDLMNSHIDQ